MSRIGQKPIEVKPGIEVKIENRGVLLRNEKGEFVYELPKGISARQEADKIIVERKNDDYKALHGLYRQLIQNGMTGLTEGFSKKLIIKGVGFRAVVEGDKLVLQVGFSHPIYVSIPEKVMVVLLALV